MHEVAAMPRQMTNSAEGWCEAMRLGITEYLDCAHYLPGHDRCGRLHGHTYRVEVVIEGEKSAGMILDFGELRKAVRDALEQYDHRSWNDFLEFPSVENICELIVSGLRERLPFPFTLRIWEGQGKWAELSSTPSGASAR
jgi:6-pyruvoyltetrahydropterin/6-carboxytetrahydropterin synthase